MTPTREIIRCTVPFLLCLLLAQSAHAQWATEHDRAAATLMALHNAERSRQGLQHLQLDPACTQAAIEQSDCQARRDRIGHDGCDGRLWYQRLATHGYRARSSSENVAAVTSFGAGRYKAEWVIEDWLASRGTPEHPGGHRANVLGNWTHAGFARRTSKSGRDYWTAVYARERR